MSESNAAPSPSAAPALPNALVLNYIAAATTPTRVRRISFQGTLVISFVYASTAVYFAILIGQWIQADVLSSPGLANHASITELLDDARWYFQEDIFPSPVPFLALAVAFPLALLNLFLAAPVMRGHRWACLLAWLGTFPIFACFTVLMLALTLPALVDVLGVYTARKPFQPWMIRAFLAPPAGTLAILMLKDLCGFLRWIARNPITEKPPVPFLPQNQPS